MTGSTPPAVPDGPQEPAAAVSAAAVHAALNAVAGYWKKAHSTLQGYPSRDLVRVMLAAGLKVEIERAEAAEARLAEIRQTLATFFVVHGNSNAASLTHARDLAEGIRQILDREAQP